MQTEVDAAVIRRSLGEPHLFAAVFDRHFDAVHRYAERRVGPDLVGEVTDPAGRPGIAVAMDDEVARIRRTLVFDPDTYVLLAEEEGRPPR
jgi:hypothetical protein